MKKTHCLPDEIETIQGIVCWSLGQLAHPFDSPKLITEMLNGMREVTGSARVDLLLYQSDMNILFFANSSSGELKTDGENKLSLADTRNSVPVQALTGGHTVLVADVRDSGFLSLSAGTRNLLSVPVVYGDRLHGVLSMEHPLADVYDSETVQWTESLSSVFAVLLEQSYIGEQMFRLNQRIIDQMTQAATETDPTYRAHAERVSEIAGTIAEEMGLTPEIVSAIRDSGFLHDVGKSGVSGNILVKPGTLSADEMTEVRRHPVLGRFLLKPLGFQPAVIDGVTSHHERWDGTGYPRGLSGNEIPISGRILAVAEALDVMTSDQPYRERMTREAALDELKKQGGHQFDPDVVTALIRFEEKQTGQ
jgi:hypothetical protein